MITIKIQSEECFDDVRMKSIISACKFENYFIDYNLDNPKAGVKVIRQICTQSDGLSTVDHVIKVYDGSKLVITYLIEDTTDSPAGNIIFERIPKFIFLPLYFDVTKENVKRIYLYTTPWKVTSNIDKLGVNLYWEVGAEVMGVTNIDDIKKLTKDEMIELRNSIFSNSSKGTPVNIEEYDDRIVIELNLKKSKKKDKETYQTCQVGFLCGLFYLFRNDGKRIIVKNHNMREENRIKATDVIANVVEYLGLDVEFEFNVEYNSMCRFLDYPEDTYTVRLPNHGSLENLSSEYFTEKTEGEKFSMTNFVEHINEKDDYELNFYNTAGGQRTPFTLLDEFGNDVSFKIPSLYKIPDCIFTHSGVMKMVEGKDERHYKHGIKELKDWDNLEKLIREKALWGGDIERYLVTDKLVLNKTHRQYAGYFLTKDDYSLNIL